MECTQLIAHVRKNEDGTWAQPHGLADHLRGTAALASGFAGNFESADWGRALGHSHDTGKGRDVWQTYLCRKSGFDFDDEAHIEGKPGRLDHSSPGAKLSEELFGKAMGRILAYAIAGPELKWRGVFHV